MTAYAIDMLEGLEDAPELLGGEQTRELLLNGAGDWEQCSWGGCALVYDADIARALCTPSELRRTRCGERRPNVSEEWLDVQARACAQACDRTLKAIAAAPVTVVVEYERGGRRGRRRLRGWPRGRGNRLQDGKDRPRGRGVMPSTAPAVPKAAEVTLRVVSFVAAIFCGDAPRRPRTPLRQGAASLGTQFCHRKPVVCRIRGRYGRAAQPGSPGSEE